MDQRLIVERIELADTGNPQTLAELLVGQIHPQLEKLFPLPIEDIALACGIEEIKTLHTDGFLGGLVQNAEKTLGFILVKEGIRTDRRRFTIAHELGHFLNPYHVVPMGAESFLCSAEHLGAFNKRNDRLGIEAQANEFAVNLLMPERQLRQYSRLWGSPSLQAILDLQSLSLVSKEAAARRFVQLHGDDCAVVFTKDGRLRYAVYGGDFPEVEPRSGELIGRNCLTCMFRGEQGDVSAQEECDSHQWLRTHDAQRWELWEEVLIQADGYRMTLLLGERSSYDADESFKRRWTPSFRK